MEVKGMLELIQWAKKMVGGGCVRCKYPMLRCIRPLMLILDSPGNQCLTKDGGLDQQSGEKERTKVHDMVAADGTIIDYDVCVRVRFAQRNGGNDTHPKPIALQRSTGGHLRGGR